MQLLSMGIVCLSSAFIILCLVRETGCPFGSGQPSPGCSSLILVVVREGYTVLWGHRGRRTLWSWASQLHPGRCWRLEEPCWQQSCQAKEESGNWSLFPKHTPHTLMDHAQSQVSAEALERGSEKGRSWHFQWEALSQAFVDMFSHLVLIIYDCGGFILITYYLKILRFRANTRLLKYKEQRW